MLREKGQISFDFLMGIVVFLFTLMFVIQFIPGLFISTSGEGSLDSVAYRTANLLVEDPGWWENSTHNGTNWEIHIGNISRIGLAEDEFPDIRRTYTPNKLNRSKMQQLMELNETMIVNNLGLYDMISGTKINYGYNISIDKNGDPLIINGSIINFGKIPSTNQDRFRISRTVLVETGRIAEFSVDELSCWNLSNESVYISVTGPQNDSVIIQIIEFNFNTTNSTFHHANLNGTNISSNNYSVYKKTNTSKFINVSQSLPVNITNVSSLRFVFNNNLFPTNATYWLELNFTNFTNASLNSTIPVTYNNRSKPLFEPANLVVRVWK